MKRGKQVTRRRAGSDGRPSRPEGDLERLLHELRVHEAELKAQNEELRRVQAGLEDARDRYRDLYDFAPVGYFTVDADGIVREANLTGCGMLGVDAAHVVGRRFSRFVAREFEDAYRVHLASALQSAPGRLCELRIVPAHGDPSTPDWRAPLSRASPRADSVARR